MQERVRYLNPFTDFGFKKLFGEEYNKDLLLDFLNQLLKAEQGNIRNLTYLKCEHLGRSEEDRRAVFDLYCENERGEKFIVEIQKTKQKFFKDRTLYYSTFPISEQAQAGDWNFELKAVYTIAILDFVFDEDLIEPEKMRYDIKLSDIATHKVFYDKLTFIYLEMPKFNKTVDELSNRFDKWLFVLKNLERLHNIPPRFQDRIFKKLFAAAEIAKLTPEESRRYEDSLKAYRDIKNSLDTAREEKQIEIALNMLSDAMSIDKVCKYTGLSSTEVEVLARKQNNKVSEPYDEYSVKKPRRTARKNVN
ncbi:MAG: hypothetical protein A2W80_05350 [Candidatus Riflebacteria bacterium GWC2_50_8]|nr:MAG: hypothetical protein A2W80_05350 [Candidatus Riflebacteria bacterium GWC2_50_8]